jgi:hypothetical protein
MFSAPGLLPDEISYIIDNIKIREIFEYFGYKRLSSVVYHLNFESFYDLDLFL